MSKKLTARQRIFVENYLATWNATRSAEKAGFAWPDKQGPRLLKDPLVQRAIEERMNAAAMPANEVLARLTQQARADFGEFLLSNGEVDWEKARNNGYLIKSVTKSPRGTRVEIYDAQAALLALARHHGLLTERVEQHTTQTQVNLYLPEKNGGDNGNA